MICKMPKKCSRAFFQFWQKVKTCLFANLDYLQTRWNIYIDLFSTLNQFNTNIKMNIIDIKIVDVYENMNIRITFSSNWWPFAGDSNMHVFLYKLQKPNLLSKPNSPLSTFHFRKVRENRNLYESFFSLFIFYFESP